MYKCVEIKSTFSDWLETRINRWFFDHQNIQVINVSVVHEGPHGDYHAFITYIEKGNT